MDARSDRRQVPPPGWYPPPGGAPGLRWWDGARWGGDVAPAPVESDLPQRFVGGFNIPSPRGRLNLAAPSAALVIDGTTVQLWQRLPFPGRTPAFEVALTDVVEAFPARTRWARRGVGFRLSDGVVAYFWCNDDPGPVLGALARRDVTVDPAGRRFSGTYAWRPELSEVATGSRLRRRGVAVGPPISAALVLVWSVFGDRLSGLPSPPLALGVVIAGLTLVRWAVVLRGQRRRARRGEDGDWT